MNVLSDKYVYCCQCQTVVECLLKSGREIYPHRPDLATIQMYECPYCHNRVGVHKGTYKALGCIPTPEIKRARMYVHNLMDPLWKSGKIKRGELYKRVSKELGYNYHNGNTKSVEELRKVYRIVLNIRKELDEKR